MRRRNKSIILIVVILAVLAGALWLGFRAFAGNEVRRFLESRGVEVHALSLEKFTPDEIIMTGIALGKDSAVKAKRVVLHRIKGRSLTSLEFTLQADGVDLCAKNTTRGLSFGGVQRIFQSAEAIENEATLSKDQRAQAKLWVRGASISARGSLASSIRAEVKAKSLEYQSAQTVLLLEGVDLTPEFRTREQVAQTPFAVKEASVKNEKGLVFTPLSLRGDALLKLTTGDLRGNFKGSDSTKKFNVSGKFTYALRTGAGNVDITTEEAMFGSSGEALKLSDLLPVMDAERPTPAMRGKLSAKVKLGREGYESVRGALNIASLDSGVLLEEALKGYGSLEGLLRASLPFEITPTGWRILNGDVRNDGPMRLGLINQEKADAVSGIVALLGKKTPEGVLDGVNISELDLKALSTDAKGEMVMQGRMRGNSPALGRDVIININISTNLMDMLKSVSIARGGVEP